MNYCGPSNVFLVMFVARTQFHTTYMNFTFCSQPQSVMLVLVLVLVLKDQNAVLVLVFVLDDAVLVLVLAA